MSRYCVVLELSPNRPAVIGTWTTQEAARRKQREWIGVYGQGQATIQLFVEEPDGRQCLLNSWP